jgi:CheY-like chemotaxis protein
LVLVIDDDASIRALVCDLLATLDCDADEAEDGATALTLLPQRRYDLVVTDLKMPGMTGWDVVDAVRASVPTMPIMMMSGFATDADRERALTAEVTMLKKPIPVADFRRAIAHALTRRLSGGSAILDARPRCLACGKLIEQSAGWRRVRDTDDVIHIDCPDPLSIAKGVRPGDTGR